MEPTDLPAMSAQQPAESERSANPGAGCVVGALVLLIVTVAFQAAGPMLCAGVLFIGATAYRRATAPDRALGAERRHLALSARQLGGLLGGSFALFALAAWIATA